MKLILAAALCFCPAWAEQIKGKVVNVHDGDTITLLADNTQHKIRLDAIDAPESKQAFGEASRKALAALVAGKQVTVDWTKRDRYQRIIGQVKIGSTEVNLKQVATGMAWHFTEYSKDKRYADAQTEAKEKKIGLWVDPQPVAPWEFRKNQKK
jgi:endonuclease YncB( thermonuclease family)